MTKKINALEKPADAAGMIAYENTLSRGYAVIWDGDRLVPRQADLADAQALDIQFADGRETVSRTAVPRKAAPKPKPPSPDDQGSLF